MAYKRELIINNGSLTSYKKLLKVSDVCQLLDKRTFKTRTGGGTTATYNNDGTFTVSGTATVNSWKNFPIFQLLPGGGEHVYLFNVVGSSEDTNCDCHIYFYDEITDRAVGLMTTGREGSAVIKKLETPTVYQARFNITTLTGATPNNIVYKPQLFDLTEMYGAGNEPATVEEFKAKFPNEMYDYSPRCWVTSYKTGLIAKTKNLFDSNNIDKQWLGISYKTVANGKILLNGTKEAGYNIYSVTTPNITLPAGTYTLSCRMLAGNIEGYDITFNRWIFFGINGSPGAYHCGGVGKVGDYETKTFTLTEDTLLSSFNITAGYTNGFNIDNVMIECQLEKGSVATEYTPYGYL